jgi:hypothetical protein
VFGGPPIRDVTGVDDDAVHGRIVETVLADRLEGPMGAVGVDRPVDDLTERARRPEDPGDLGADGLEVVGVHEITRRPPGHGLGRIAQQAGDRRTGIGQDRVLVQHQHEVRGLLDEGTELGFGPGPLGDVADHRHRQQPALHVEASVGDLGVELDAVPPSMPSAHQHGVASGAADRVRGRARVRAQVGGPHARELLYAPPVQRRRGGIRVHDFEGLDIGHQHRVVARFEEKPIGRRAPAHELPARPTLIGRSIAGPGSLLHTRPPGWSDLPDISVPRRSHLRAITHMGRTLCPAGEADERVRPAGSSRPSWSPRVP